VGNGRLARKSLIGKNTRGAIVPFCGYRYYTLPIEGVVSEFWNRGKGSLVSVLESGMETSNLNHLQVFLCGMLDEVCNLTGRQWDVARVCLFLNWGIPVSLEGWLMA